MLRHRLTYGLAAWTLMLSALPALAADAGAASADPAYPAYTAEQTVSGTIRTWGHGSRADSYASALVAAWQDGFRRLQPGVAFETTLRGTSTGIGGLYTGAADLALMERAPIAIELDAYQPIFKTDPFAVSVATGSLDVAHHNPALVVFVHRDNPLAQLTLAQLDAVLGADHRRGTHNIRTWGELGLRGAWAQRRIHLYVPQIAGDDGQFLEHAVMGGSQKWNGALRELGPQAGQPDAGQRILDAAAADPYALAVSTMVYRNAGVKPLAVAAQDGAPYVAPTRASVADRSYPLTRTVSIMLNRAPGQPVEPRLKEYLAYILSDQGQSAVAADGKYFPLSPQTAREEWSKLK